MSHVYQLHSVLVYSPIRQVTAVSRVQTFPTFPVYFLSPLGSSILPSDFAVRFTAQFVMRMRWRFSHNGNPFTSRLGTQVDECGLYQTVPSTLTLWAEPLPLGETTGGLVPRPPFPQGVEALLAGYSTFSYPGNEVVAPPLSWASHPLMKTKWVVAAKRVTRADAQIRGSSWLWRCKTKPGRKQELKGCGSFSSLLWELFPGFVAVRSDPQNVARNHRAGVCFSFLPHHVPSRPRVVTLGAFHMASAQHWRTLL